MIKLILPLIKKVKKNKNNHDFIILPSSYELNLAKDKIDNRDYCYNSVKQSEMLSVSYTIPNLPPVRNQGSLSSCASHAVIGCYETQLSKHRFIEGSERFHYYTTRKYLTGDMSNSSGMSIRDACKSLYNYGMGLEMLCPYSIKDCNIEPSLLTYMFAKLYKVARYESLNDIEDIKDSIYDDIPVVCGIQVSGNFYSLNMDSYLYKPTPKSNGGHGVYIVGYDDKRSVFILRNSWAYSFGNDGDFEMSYKDFLKYSFDWWRIIIKK